MFKRSALLVLLLGCASPVAPGGDIVDADAGINDEDKTLSVARGGSFTCAGRGVTARIYQADINNAVTQCVTLTGPVSGVWGSGCRNSRGVLHDTKRDGADLVMTFFNGETLDETLRLRNYFRNLNARVYTATLKQYVGRGLRSYNMACSRR